MNQVAESIFQERRIGRTKPKRNFTFKLVAMLPKCHICGESGVYTEMKDYLIYSVHPKCERGLLSLSLSPKEFQICSLCKKTLLSSKDEFKTHLVNYHSKEALADLITNYIVKI